MSLLSSNEGKQKEDSHYVLVGLHTCGNLSTTMLRLFSQSESIIGLVSVGCCYMKLFKAEEPSLLVVPSGYPMSSSLANHRLSYEARELACHSKEVYMKRLQGLMIACSILL